MPGKKKKSEKKEDPAGKSPGAAAKNFRLYNLKLIQTKLQAGKTLNRNELKTLREFEEEEAMREAESSADQAPPNLPVRVGTKAQAVKLCRVTETQFDAAMRATEATTKQPNGQWLMGPCWKATADFRAGKGADEKPAELDFTALKAREEYERVRDGNLIRRGQLLKKSEQLEMIAAGFAPLKHYLENGVNALAQKVAERPRAQCEVEIRKFFHTILKQIGNAEFPPEVVETLLHELARSTLAAAQSA